jgi:octaprenyl-diphosphate synthase
MAVIDALGRCTDSERETIKSVMREAGFVSVRHEDILAILKKYDSVESALLRANEFAVQAKSAIEEFPDSEYKRALLWVPEFVVERDK